VNQNFLSLCLTLCDTVSDDTDASVTQMEYSHTCGRLTDCGHYINKVSGSGA